LYDGTEESAYSRTLIQKHIGPAGELGCSRTRMLRLTIIYICSMAMSIE
jgi:hypothetical protein